MTKQTWLERNGATRGKLALVGILAVMLVTVMWHNFAGSEPPANAKNTRPTTPQREAKAAVKPSASLKPAPTKPEQVAKTPRVWPKHSLEKVARHDPLTKPMWYLVAQAAETGSPDASLARSAQVLEELKKESTKIVVISGGERIATIGELSLRVGDTIEGFQVTEITTDGIVLTEIGR